MEKLMLGIAREDFSPDKPVRMNSKRTGEYVREPIYATALSFSQADTRVLVISLDLRQVYSDFIDAIKPLITEVTGVAAENIFCMTNHNHSCPDISTTSNEGVNDWKARIGIPAIVRAAKTAVEDEKEVTGMVGRSGFVDGMGYVRRNQRTDGNWSGIFYNNPNKVPVARHESDADRSLRAVRISRKDGKALVLTHCQIHCSSALGEQIDAVCADFVGPLREKLEAAEDCVALYLQGACGNINQNTLKEDEKAEQMPDYRTRGEAMAQWVQQILADGKPLQVGKLQFCSNELDCYVNHTRDHLVEKIQKIKAQVEDPEARKEQLKEIGVPHPWVADTICRLANMEEIDKMPLAAISIGDLAITFEPTEIFDICGKQLREASPFAMTMNCCYSLGYNGYIPAYRCWPHGNYEVEMCRYLPGIGESIVLAHLANLQDMKNT